jgi:hypothetical protein
MLTETNLFVELGVRRLLCALSVTQTQRERERAQSGTVRVRERAAPLQFHFKSVTPRKENRFVGSMKAGFTILAAVGDLEFS